MSDIELVIKIPEKTYKHILSMQFYISSLRSGKSLLEEILKAIRNGIPLPKGHGNLVDYEELKNNAREYGAYVEATLSHIKPKTIIEADKGSEE